MAYNENKLVLLGSLKKFTQRIKADYPTKAAFTSSMASKADKSDTLAGYGIADAYTKNEIEGKISSVYKPGGSTTVAALPAADKEHLGMVYNVTDAFTTTENFIEGAGSEHPAGTNVVIVASGEAFKYDVLAGFVDLSDYAKSADVVAKAEGQRLMTDTEATKLAGIAEGATKVEASTTNGNIKVNGAETTVVEFATDAEAEEMLNEVLGTQS